MTEHIDDQTPGSKSLARHDGLKDVSSEFVASQMKDGDVLKLRSDLRVGEFSWQDLDGNMKSQDEITAAQLLVARETKIVLPDNTAKRLAQQPKSEWSKLARACKTMYGLYRMGKAELPPALNGTEYDTATSSKAIDDYDYLSDCDDSY